MTPHLKHHTKAPKLPGGKNTDPTLELRDDLVAARTAPPASAYARPVYQAPAYACLDDVHVCLHWNAGDYATAPGPQAVPGPNTWLGQVAGVVDHVAATYIQAGYRTPKPDNGKEDPSIAGDVAHQQYTDIYLADTGIQSKYGYCSVDATPDAAGGLHLTNAPAGRAGDVPAFCVLDDDFSAGQFGNRSTPLQALEVTVAHEYFHAVQFAYDFFEDRWFMEATAVWAEDELYTDINDNLQYVPLSQLRTPRLSLDDDNGNQGFLHYGDWIFFRYLTEHYPQTTGPLPNLILAMWQDADSLGQDMYSTQAIVAALRSRHVDFNRVFAQYADALHHPGLSWSEGAANHYPTAPVAKRATLRPSHRSTGGTFKVDHLASATVRVTPAHLKAARFKLRVSVRMARRRLGSAAVVSVFYRDGSVGTRTLRLTRRGTGGAVTAFSSRKVRFVEVTLANASHRFRCWTHTSYSCMGTPLGDPARESWSVRVTG